MIIETMRSEEILPPGLVGATVIAAYETVLRCGGRAGIRLRLADGREIVLGVSAGGDNDEPALSAGSRGQ